MIEVSQETLELGVSDFVFFRVELVDDLQLARVIYLLIQLKFISLFFLEILRLLLATETMLAIRA